MFASCLQQKSLSYRQTQYHCSFILTGNQITRPWHLLFLVRGQHCFQKQESASKEKNYKQTAKKKIIIESKTVQQVRVVWIQRAEVFQKKANEWRPLIQRWAIYKKGSRAFVVKKKWKFVWISSTNMWTVLKELYHTWLALPHREDQRGYQHSCTSADGCAGVHPLTKWDHNKELRAVPWGWGICSWIGAFPWNCWQKQ